MMFDRIDPKCPPWWTVEDVLTDSECRGLIERIEASSPEIASISAIGGPVVDERSRNNTRVISDDAALAATLFGRVQATIPGRVSSMDVVGANERLRYYRYERGQRFAPHHDGSFVRNIKERSLLTLIVYLNDDFEGGCTSFLDLRVDVKPKRGMALLFQHDLLHEGAEVTSGVKYVVRTDVMFHETTYVRPW